MFRSVAHEAVYQILKEMKECPAEKDSVPVVEAFEVQSIGVPPLRDKLPSLDWERLRWQAERVVQETELLGEFWSILEDWAERYFEGNANHIWQKLGDLTGKKPTLGGGRSRRRQQRRGRGAVCFD
ncbi:hypothetical protein GN958_ATG21828 [Phytophthora infestans]|uniref:Uncharacterized protein n=2 Tax=Phytophthora infestans TaxID=4787 RepID=A0A8S9TQ17_PHYIN|nr:hypothetical protein GN958_ATG21828 [Phytophthora infestans]